MKIQAILLDVGNVLVDETEFYKLIQDQLLELLQNDGFEVTSSELMELFLNALSRGISNYRATILWHFARPDLERFQRLRKGLKPLRDFDEIWKPQLFSSAKEVVASLSRKYRLALAGNQPTKIKEFLKSQGILPYFQYDLVSEELGLAKPDPLFFQIILDRLGVSAEEAVMVGDRLDNDILPAKRLGLKTIRFLVWPFALQQERSPEERPDLTIKELSELPAALEELSRQ